MNENRPEKKFRAGSVVANVWSNLRKVSGREVAMKSVLVERRYKDTDGTWKSSPRFSMNELPKVALVLSQAYEYLLQGEDDGGDGQ